MNDEHSASGVIDELSGSPLTLTNAKIDVSVYQFTARVKVVHTYRNDLNKRTPCKFVFPIEDGWNVCSFSAELPRRKVTSSVGERTEFKEYKEGMLVCKLPGLVYPAAFVTTTVHMLVDLVELSNTHSRLRLPASIVPTPEPEDKERGWDNMFQVAQSNTPKTLSLHMHLQMDAEVESAASINHKIALKHTGSEAEGVFERTFEQSEQVSLEQEVLLEIVTKDAQQMMQVFMVKEIGDAHPQQQYALTLPIVPALDTQQQVINSDLVFVLDCSGSMHSKMAVVERTVKLALQSMPVTARFNVILFGDGVDVLSPASLEFTEENLQWARAFVHNLSADRGATDLNKALTAAYGLELPRGCCRQIFLFTDGHVNRPYETVRLVKHNIHSTRIHAFAMDMQAEHVDLMQTLADASRGTVAFLPDASGLTERFLQTLQAALQPALTNVDLTFTYEQISRAGDYTEPEDAPPIQLAEAVPLLFAGERYRAFAFAEGTLRNNAVAVLSAWYGQKRYEWKYVLGDVSDFVQMHNNEHTGDRCSLLHAAVAARRVRALCEYFQTTAVSKAGKQEALDLSVRYNIMSPFSVITQQCELGPAPDTATASARAATPRKDLASADLTQPKEVAYEFGYSLPRDVEHSLAAQPRRKPVHPQPGKKTITPLPDRDNVVFEQAPALTTYQFMREIVEDLVEHLCHNPCLDDVVFCQAAPGNWTLDPRFARALDLNYHAIVRAAPQVPASAAIDVPAVGERMRRLEDQRRRSDESAAEDRRKEEETRVRLAKKEYAKQRRLQAERAKDGEDALEEQRRADEEAEKARRASELAEKDRREREEARLDKERKAKEKERQKLIRKLGKDAVKRMEEEELRKAQEEAERGKLEEDAALRRDHDAKAAWEARERRKYVNTVWATAVGVSFLKLQYAQQSTEFDLIAARALAWLRGTGVPGVADWPAKAAEFLKPLLQHKRRIRDIELVALQEAVQLMEDDKARQAAQADQLLQMAVAEQRQAEEQEAAAALLARREQDAYTTEEETPDTRAAALAAQQEAMRPPPPPAVEEEPAVAEEAAEEEAEEVEEVPEEGEPEDGDEPPEEEIEEEYEEP